MISPIYKKALPYRNQAIEIVEGVLKVLSVQLQQGFPMLWFVSDENVPGQTERSQVTIICVGTGYHVKDHWQHIGTVVDDADGYVWHYFITERR